MALDKIAVIDDDEDVLAVLTDIISQAGHEPIVISDSTVALEQLVADPPAMIFTDVQMPGLNGFQLLKAIRENEKLAKTPVVILSSISAVTGTIYDPDKIETTYGVRPDAFVSKPVFPAAVNEQIEKYLKTL